MNQHYHTIIIGAGVAGMTAALYLKRAGKKVLVIEKDAPGGQITRTSKIENYPGFVSIEGPELAFTMYEQLTNLEVEFAYSEVTSIKGMTPYQVITDKEIYTSDYIILALGRKPRKLNVKNEEKLTGKGISWCAVCDGPLYKNKRVAVIGGGRSALEETIYLSKLCKEVTLIHRRDDFRADNELIDNVNSIENIQIITNAEVVEFKEKDGILDKIILTSKKQPILEVDGCFEFIGQEPSTSFLKETINVDQEGYIEVDQEYQTSLPHVYACGDCLKKDLYQIINACSEGAIVANTILKQ